MFQKRHDDLVKSGNNVYGTYGRIDWNRYFEEAANPRSLAALQPPLGDQTAVLTPSVCVSKTALSFLASV